MDRCFELHFYTPEQDEILPEPTLFCTDTLGFVRKTVAAAVGENMEDICFFFASHPTPQLICPLWQIPNSWDHCQSLFSGEKKLPLHPMVHRKLFSENDFVVFAESPMWSLPNFCRNVIVAIRPAHVDSDDPVVNWLWPGFRLCPSGLGPIESLLRHAAKEANQFDEKTSTQKNVLVVKHCRIAIAGIGKIALQHFFRDVALSKDVPFAMLSQRIPTSSSIKVWSKATVSPSLAFQSMKCKAPIEPDGIAFRITSFLETISHIDLLESGVFMVHWKPNFPLEEVSPHYYLETSRRAASFLLQGIKWSFEGVDLRAEFHKFDLQQTLAVAVPKINEVVDDTYASRLLKDVGGRVNELLMHVDLNDHVMAACRFRKSRDNGIACYVKAKKLSLTRTTLADFEAPFHCAIMGLMLVRAMLLRSIPNRRQISLLSAGVGMKEADPELDAALQNVAVTRMAWSHGCVLGISRHRRAIAINPEDEADQSVLEGCHEFDVMIRFRGVWYVAIDDELHIGHVVRFMRWIVDYSMTHLDEAKAMIATLEPVARKLDSAFNAHTLSVELLKESGCDQRIVGYFAPRVADETFVHQLTKFLSKNKSKLVERLEKFHNGNKRGSRWPKELNLYSKLVFAEPTDPKYRNPSFETGDQLLVFPKAVRNRNDRDIHLLSMLWRKKLIDIKGPGREELIAKLMAPKMTKKITYVMKAIRNLPPETFGMLPKNEALLKFFPKQSKEALFVREGIWVDKTSRFHSLHAMVHLSEYMHFSKKPIKERERYVRELFEAELTRNDATTFTDVETYNRNMCDTFAIVKRYNVIVIVYSASDYNDCTLDFSGNFFDAELPTIFLIRSRQSDIYEPIVWRESKSRQKRVFTRRNSPELYERLESAYEAFAPMQSLVIRMTKVFPEAQQVVLGDMVHAIGTHAGIIPVIHYHPLTCIPVCTIHSDMLLYELDVETLVDFFHNLAENLRCAFYRPRYLLLNKGFVCALVLSHTALIVPLKTPEPLKRSYGLDIIDNGKLEVPFIGVEPNPSVELPNGDDYRSDRLVLLEALRALTVHVRENAMEWEHLLEVEFSKRRELILERFVIPATKTLLDDLLLLSPKNFFLILTTICVQNSDWTQWTQHISDALEEEAEEVIEADENIDFPHVESFMDWCRSSRMRRLH